MIFGTCPLILVWITGRKTKRYLIRSRKVLRLNNSVMLAEFKKKLEKDGVLYLKVKAKPGMAETEVKEIMSDGTIKVNIAAPAEKGKANRALVGFLAEEFRVRKSEVNIISGAGEKLKLIKIITA